MKERGWSEWVVYKWMVGIFGILVLFEGIWVILVFSLGY